MSCILYRLKSSFYQVYVNYHIALLIYFLKYVKCQGHIFYTDLKGFQQGKHMWNMSIKALGLVVQKLWPTLKLVTIIHLFSKVGQMSSRHI